MHSRSRMVAFDIAGAVPRRHKAQVRDGKPLRALHVAGPTSSCWRRFLKRTKLRPFLFFGGQHRTFSTVISTAFHAERGAHEPQPRLFRAFSPADEKKADSDRD